MWLQVFLALSGLYRDAVAANKVSPQDQAKISAEMDKNRTATQTVVDEFNSLAPGAPE